MAPLCKRLLGCDNEKAALNFVLATNHLHMDPLQKRLGLVAASCLDSLMETDKSLLRDLVDEVFLKKAAA